MTTSLLIEPGNPHDFTPAELEELRSEVEDEFDTVRVAIARRPERGYGVSFHEVLAVWDVVTEAADDVMTVAGPISLIVGWMRRRAQRERERHPGARPRPRTVPLIGPDGKVLKRIVIDDPDADPRIEDGGGEYRVRPDSD
jgi:hypothetical protein